MRRAVLICLVLGASASAGPRKWTLPLPPGWTDTTAEANRQPGIIALTKTLTDKGGRFETESFASPDGDAALLLGTLQIPDALATMSELDTFERSARERASQGGAEAYYHEERTAKTLGSTARITGKASANVTRRITGYVEGGGVLSLSVICYGEATVCDPLVASAVLDTASLVALDSVGAGGKSTAYRIGALVGSVLIVLVLVGAFWTRRRKPPAI
ncbi:hypothetical protein BH11MYX3_BH11MYX3_08530 [soil metagenome]